MISPLLQLLETIESHKFVETYRYFPDVVLSGESFLDKDDINTLLKEGYLEMTRQDSFGQFLELSQRAKEILQRETSYNLQ